MGARGLLRECIKNKDMCADSVDLVQEARDRNGIEILVDYSCLRLYIQETFWKNVSQTHNNEFLVFLGGEYGALEAQVTNFVTLLREVKIDLVLFEDGGCGSSITVHEQKEKTLKVRFKRWQESAKEMLASCEENWQEARPTTPKETEGSCDICIVTQLKEIFTRCGCEFVSLPSGEADYVLAKALHERPKAYAILSNDADFAIFEGSRFISTHTELFDVDQQVDIARREHHLKTLKCYVIHSEKVANFLKVRTIVLMS